MPSMLRPGTEGDKDDDRLSAVTFAPGAVTFAQGALTFVPGAASYRLRCRESAPMGRDV
jgi:hypothetical protein